ncbi:MAG: rubrerythrin family protein [Desulfobulbaceae bacterium]|uniref:Rubrerythrin family protein n=1 Tax=Candidatus Desulfatifera sulfidica TaxID=2841691 RepID=A0A8J6TCP5_9BACT|nr:rubrerythrin family protein [Candidatus Desulfatifera sulfidica]
MQVDLADRLHFLARVQNCSRRKLLVWAACAGILYPLRPLTAFAQGGIGYPQTVQVLREGFLSETAAHNRYLEYMTRALAEDYGNIAYLFSSFARSEAIHARNYSRVLQILGVDCTLVQGEFDIGDTRSNLKQAAARELEKIESVYPAYISRLEEEQFAQALLHCRYAWDAHRQHKDKLTQIMNYSGFFMGAVIRKLEDIDFDFFVCQVCGSTLDGQPQGDCPICGSSVDNYNNIERPQPTYASIKYNHSEKE